MGRERGLTEQLELVVRNGVFRHAAVVGVLALVFLAGCRDSAGPLHVDLSGTWRASANAVGDGAGITMTLTEDAAGTLTGTWTRECPVAGCPQTGPVRGTHTDGVTLSFDGYRVCINGGQGCIFFDIGFEGAVRLPFEDRLSGTTTPFRYPLTFER